MVFVRAGTAGGDFRMATGNSLAHSELPKLKSLASDLLAAESPDPSVLDEIASLAAAIAAHCREQARAELLGLVVEAARAIFPDAADDLRSRLAGSSHADLSGLGSLLDDANEARTAFARADAGLMEARGRGDYGAMVPLALEAEGRKKALAAASAEFVNRTGCDASLLSPIAVAPANGATGRDVAAQAAPPPASPTDFSPAPAAEAAPEAPAAMLSRMPAEPAALPMEPDPPGESPTGRRRIRDLIRQVRTMPEDALPAR